METWKKLVATESDIEFEYFDRLKRPVLAYQGLSLPFSSVFLQERPAVQEERLR